MSLTSTAPPPRAEAPRAEAPRTDDGPPNRSRSHTGESRPRASDAEEASARGEGFTLLGPVASRVAARDHGLVLSSMGIQHSVRSLPGGWVLLVHDRDYRRARTAIDRYDEENRDWPPRRPRDTPRFPFSPTFAIGFLAVAAFFAWFTGPVGHPRGSFLPGTTWFSEGSSVAAQVVASEPWRAVTALTLHADGAHVMGNVVSGTVFGTAVGRRLGAGFGGLAIVVSGALGNLANAAYYDLVGESHASIGASTAVFGAVGLLAATALWALAWPERRGEIVTSSDAKVKRRWYEWAAPLLGGLGLLGALGASPSSDLGAHGFGLLAGLLVGFAAAATLALARRVRPLAHDSARWSVLQLTSGVAAVGLVVGSWSLALAG